MPLIEKRICPECGTHNIAKFKFCESCGKRLPKVQKVSKPVPDNVPVVTAEPQKVVDAKKVVESEKVVEPEQEKPARAALFDWNKGFWWAVILLAVFMRFYELGDKPLHHDESIHASSSYDLYTKGDYQYKPGYHGPLAYYLISSSFFLFGDTDTTARLPFAVLGLAMIGLAAGFKPYLGSWGSKALALLLALSPTLVYQSRYARMDILIAFLDMLMIWSALEWRRTGKRLFLYLAAASFGLAFATKEVTYINMFIFISFLAFMWLYDIIGERDEGWGPRIQALKKEGFGYWHVGGALGLGFSTIFLIESYSGLVLFAYIALMGMIGWIASQPGSGKYIGGLSLAFLISTAFGAAFFNQHIFQVLSGYGGKTILFGLNIIGLGLMVGGVALYTRSLRLSLVGFSVFIMIPFTLLFTSFFSNPKGFADGFYRSLYYWLTQQHVARGGQPLWYYILLIPAYELLTLTGLLAGIFTLFTKYRTRWLLFLVYWFVMALVIYSMAGEKMPWLVVHMTLPMIFATAYTIQAALNFINSESGTAWKQTTVAGLGLLALVLLGGLYVRHSVGLSLYRPGDPHEPMVYVQTGYDAIEITNIINEIAYRETGGVGDFHLTIEDSCTWPFAWYLRKFTKRAHPHWLGAEEQNPIIMTGVNSDKHSSGKSRDDYNKEILGDRYVERKFNLRVWWYPQKHAVQGAPGVGGSLPSFSYWWENKEKLWDFMIYRKVWEPPGRWADSFMMRLWIRNDVWERYKSFSSSYWRNKKYR